MKNIIIILLSVFALTSCGTIVNDPNVPVSLSFSDGSDGKCKLNNKRASYSVSIPSTTMVNVLLIKKGYGLITLAFSFLTWAWSNIHKHNVCLV